MGMLNNGRSTVWRWLLRALLLAGGVASLLWAIALLPEFWRAVPARDAVARIIADERFKPGALANLLRVSQVQSGAVRPRSELLRANALVSQRIAEESMMGRGSEEGDRGVDLAWKALRAAIEVSPNDSFLWLMLYAVEINRTGLSSQYISYLDQSYEAGPREGWIAPRRNRLSLAAFPILNSVTKSAAVEEFAAMVDADFIENAALNLMGLGWQYRAQLLAALETVDLASRERLNRRLSADGVKLAIPGLSVDDRPWR